MQPQTHSDFRVLRSATNTKKVLSHGYTLQTFFATHGPYGSLHCRQTNEPDANHGQHMMSVLPSIPQSLISWHSRICIARTALHHHGCSRCQHIRQIVVILRRIWQLVHHHKHLRKTKKWQGHCLWTGGGLRPFAKQCHCHYFLILYQ